MRMTKLWLAAFLLLLPSIGQARVVEKIVALVGSDIILQSEVEERAAPMMADIAAIPNPGQRAARASALRRQILERSRFIDRRQSDGVSLTRQRGT